jgi:DNA-binding NarL/FixJ family response regulator
VIEALKIKHENCMDMIKVVVIEDDSQLNGQLCDIINGMQDGVCLNSFANAEDALLALPDLLADVVVMDINLPGMSGIDCTRSLKEILPSIQVLMCSVYDDDDRLFESLRAGATGYLLKSEVLEKLADAIRMLIQGGSPMSPGIARRVIGFLQQPPKPTQHIDLLTPREKEILDWLSKGYRYKEIASGLELSIDTIRKHVRNIYYKLQVQSRTDALNKVYPK